MIFILKNNKSKILIIYTFLLFALTILLGFFSIPIYAFNQNLDYSQVYITCQSYLGETYSSALENNERNLINLRLALKSFVCSSIFILLLRAFQKLRKNIKIEFNPVILIRKLRRLLVIKQNTGVYKVNSII